MFIYFFIIPKISNIFALHYLEDLLNLMTLERYPSLKLFIRAVKPDGYFQEEMS